MQQFYNELLQHLEKIEQELKRCNLWQSIPPKSDAFLSEQPFSLDTMSPCEWLQWVFIARMRALIDAKTVIPRQFSLFPYFEESFKEQKEYIPLLARIELLDNWIKE